MSRDVVGPLSLPRVTAIDMRFDVALTTCSHAPPMRTSTARGAATTVPAAVQRTSSWLGAAWAAGAMAASAARVARAWVVLRTTGFLLSGYAGASLQVVLVPSSQPWP